MGFAVSLQYVNLSSNLFEISQISRALHSELRPIQHVGINHSSSDIGMVKQFLNRSDVIVGFKKMSRE
jgi:hypothetical protein